MQDKVKMPINFFFGEVANTVFCIVAHDIHVYRNEATTQMVHNTLTYMYEQQISRKPCASKVLQYSFRHTGPRYFLTVQISS